MFNIPDYWSFPPLFTIQPCESTKEKQMKMWSDIILKYHESLNENIMVPGSFEYFTNANIDRTLSQAGRILVCDYMVLNGQAEWIGEDMNIKNRIRLIFKSVDTLAGELYKYADTIGLKGQVLTIYELHSGEEHHDASFAGSDPIMIERALEKLQNEGKCTIFSGESDADKGVKFD